MLTLVYSKLYFSNSIFSSPMTDFILLIEGFWGGLVPENAFNETALERLLSAGALGLKVLLDNFSV